MNKMMKAGILVLLVLSLVCVGFYAIHASRQVSSIDSQALIERADDPTMVLIDIRTQDEVDQGVIPGSLHIPIKKIMRNVALLDKYAGKDVVFYCRTGVRVKRLTDYLKRMGHEGKSKLYHLEGDMKGWRDSGHTVVMK